MFKAGWSFSPSLKNPTPCQDAFHICPLLLSEALGKGPGPPSQRESKGSERLRQDHKAPQLERAKASTPLGKATCKSSLDAAGHWGPGRKGTNRGRQLWLLSRGRWGGMASRRLCLPHLGAPGYSTPLLTRLPMWYLPPNKGRSYARLHHCSISSAWHIVGAQ